MRSRPTLVLLALVAAASLVASACGSDTSGEAGPSTDGSTDGSTDEGSATLELGLGDGGAMASCLAVDAAALSEMSPAFAGTVTSVDGETITLGVDKWYAGADEASTVELHAPDGLEALIGGIDFQVDEQYLITAAGDTVNYCGYSGPADDTLTALFEEAFAG